MPFEIVRNDIVNMKVDAVVNTANPRAEIGAGVDSAIHKAAGPKLMKARKAIGEIPVGEAALTRGFNLDAKYVIHAVGPAWLDGEQGEAQLLRTCYDNALRIALEHGCESIAFPLLSAGTYGFPKALALQIAVSAFSAFLMEHDMQIYLVVFSKETVVLSEKLVRSVSQYIDENYVREKHREEYDEEEASFRREMSGRRARLAPKKRPSAREIRYSIAPPPSEDRFLDELKELRFVSEDVGPVECVDFDELLDRLDAGFSETLLKMIDRTGKADAEIYRKANVDRKLFSKIRNNPQYKPSKMTALAFAIALELNLEETQDLIGRAGYALSHSSMTDVIVEHFIKTGNYDVFEMNEVLFKYDCSLIGV